MELSKLKVSDPKKSLKTCNPTKNKFMSLVNQREDFLETLDTFTAQRVDEYKNNLTQLFPAEGTKFESDQERSNFIKSFLRKIRLFLKIQMEATTFKGSDFYNNDTNEILRFTFWAAKNGYIDTANAFIIMEDIYDCLSLSEISSFFHLLEELVNLFETLSPTEQQALLRIGNSILKKFSKVHDNDFRGRVQLFLAKITSISDKTAVNAASNINIANQTIFASSINEEDSAASKQFKNQDFKELSNLRVNFGTYRKFWELQKFLQNPELLFSNETSIILEDDEALEGEKKPEEDAMEIESINEKPKRSAIHRENKVVAFCQFIEEIIEIFRKDPLPEAPDIFRQKNYPKYLTKYSILSIQLKDPNFRKSWLTQIILRLESIKNPLKLDQKKGFEIKEADLERIKNLEKKVTDYIKEIPTSLTNGLHLDKQLDFFLEREKNWANWKDGGCQPFDKAVTPAETAQFSNMKDNKNLAANVIRIPVNPSKPELYPNYKARDPQYKIIAETSERFMKDINWDKDNAIFKYLHKPQLPHSLEALEPGVSYYFNSFLSEMKDPTLTEEDKLASDSVTVWRALRILGKNCMNMFNTAKTEPAEVKLDDVLKKMLKDPSNPPEKAEGEGAQEQKAAAATTPVEEKPKEEAKKEESGTEMKEEKPKEEAPVERIEKPEKSDKSEKPAEKPAEKAVEKPREFNTNRGENREDSRQKEKITERIKARGSDKSGEKNITINRKRSPEGDIKDDEKNSTHQKKTKS